MSGSSLHRLLFCDHCFDDLYLLSLARHGLSRKNGSQQKQSGEFIAIFSSVMHSMSRGSVHINPASPRGRPIIDLKYFTNEYDVSAVMEGARHARKVAETEPWPAVQTEAQFRDFAVKTVNSFYHPIGTCAMLPKKDGGVVDSNLIVYGTTNLRVVDASIIPIQMSGQRCTVSRRLRRLRRRESLLLQVSSQAVKLS
jgi:choline dehydrogenase-like flavoprotein